MRTVRLHVDAAGIRLGTGAYCSTALVAAVRVVGEGRWAVPIVMPPAKQLIVRHGDLIGALPWTGTDPVETEMLAVSYRLRWLFVLSPRGPRLANQFVNWPASFWLAHGPVMLTNGVFTWTVSTNGAVVRRLASITDVVAWLAACWQRLTHR